MSAAGPRGTDIEVLVLENLVFVLGEGACLGILMMWFLH